MNKLKQSIQISNWNCTWFMIYNHLIAFSFKSTPSLNNLLSTNEKASPSHCLTSKFRHISKTQEMSKVFKNKENFELCATLNLGFLSVKCVIVKINISFFRFQGRLSTQCDVKHEFDPRWNRVHRLRGLQWVLSHLRHLSV